MSKRVSCFMSIVLVLMLTGLAQAELLVNPGFEDGLDGWSPWGGGSGSGTGGYFWEEGYHADIIEDGTAHGGAKYISAGLPNNHDGWWWGAMWVMQERPATEGVAYVISGWVRDGDANGVPGTIAGGVDISFEWRDAAPDADGRGEELPDTRVNVPFDLTEEWTYVSAIAVAPPGTQGLTVAFMTAPGINIDIDDASLTEVPAQARQVTDVGALLNGDFEYWSDHPDADTWAYVSTIQDDPAVGWTASSSAWIDNGYWGYEHILGTNGVSATVVSWGDADSAMAQNLGATFQAGETYTFSIDIFGESAELDTGGQGAGENWCIGIGTAGAGDLNADVRQKSALALAASNGAVGPYYWIHPEAFTVLDPPDIFAGWQTRSVSYTATPEDDGKEINVFFSGGFMDVGSDLDTVFDNAVFSHEVFVSTVEELEAAVAAAMPDDVINLAEGVYEITSPIEVKDGVTIRGAGPGLTIIDGNDLTRGFVAWGDPGAANGQLYVTGEPLVNFTGPIEWAIEDLTIQNCVADANNRADILSAARELLNEGGAPYSAATAAEASGAIADNPEWFVVLSGENVAPPVDIPVPDAGFDDQVLSAGGYAYIGEGQWDGELDYPGPWLNTGGDAWIDNGYYANDSDLPAVSGDNKLYGYEATEDAIYQILGETFVEGATYTLSVYEGSAWAGEPNAWSLSFIGADPNEVLAETSGNGPVGAWEQVSLTYTATADDAGKPIGIKLKADAWVTLDEVSLSVVDPANVVIETTAEELEAYLANNAPGSAGHLVANEGMNTGGGALIVRNTAVGTVRNCVFLNNQAPLNSGDGGAINVGSAGTVLTIENSEFIGNSCDDGGGAIRVSSGATCIINGTIFTENQCVGDSADGGAIMVSNLESALTVTDSEFNGNSCVDGGGAMRLGGNTCTYTIIGSTFTGNHIVGDSGDGGAIKIDGDYSSNLIVGCAFIGNYTNDDGAAINYNPDRAELAVLDCSFIGNGMDPNGEVMTDDGIFRVADDDAGPVTLENCLFADNVTNDDRIVELKAVFSVLNCTFINNVAGDKPILALRGRAWDSTGDGEDDATSDDSIIDNCLFINNTTLSDERVVGDTRNEDFAPIVTNCLFFGNINENEETAANTDDRTEEVGTIDVSAITDASEIVVDPDGDYRPAAGSPAIDASNPATATEADIEGTPAKGVRDVGAYENTD